MIVNHRGLELPADARGWHKAISQPRDRMQRELLVGAVGMVLCIKAVLEIARLHGSWAWTFRTMPLWFWTAFAVSAAFALLVWLLKSATGPAAAMGGLVSLHVLFRQQLGGTWEGTAMPSLLALFLLTFAATRFGRARKEAMGVSEGPSGRRASQVLANLGVAGILAAGGAPGSFISSTMLAACIAALAEATADTVSSELGQALAGKTLLITTGRLVPPGTDGGVSVVGTVFGALAAAIVVALSPVAKDWQAALAVFMAACGGLLFDSVLGATLERRGWIGNDLVNFTSTVFAAALAWAAMAL